jgi:hypothetical protein
MKVTPASSASGLGTLHRTLLDAGIENELDFYFLQVRRRTHLNPRVRENLASLIGQELGTFQHGCLLYQLNV